MLKYNLLEYSSNYSETTCSIWFYSYGFNNITYGNNFKSSNYKTKLVGQTEALNRILENATIALPLNI